MSQQKPVCITGVSGYIGGFVMEEFLRNGVDVHATVRDPQSEKNQFLYRIEAKYSDCGGGKLTVFAADLNTTGSFDAAIGGCDVVVHVAASVGSYYKKDPYEELINPNIRGVRNVVDSCLKFNVKKIVYTSSVATIQCSDEFRSLQERGRPFTEDMWASHCTPTYSTYNYSKVKAEEELMKLWKVGGEEGRSLISLLPSWVVGPVQNDRVTSSMQAIRALVNHEFPGAPPFYYCWGDVRDVAKAHYIAAISSEAEFPSGRYNVSQNQVLRWADFSIAINKSFPQIKAPTRELPYWVLWCVSFLDRRLGTHMLRERTTKISPIDSSKIQRNTPFVFEYNDIERTLYDAVVTMREHGLVKS